MRRFFVIFMVLTTPFLVIAQENTKADQILKEVSEKTRSFENLSADFVFTMENKEMEINEKNKGTININGQKYVVDLPGIGIKVYSDGETIWNYMKDGNQVTVSNLEGQGNELMEPSSIFTIYEKGFKSKYIGEKREGNKLLYQIEMYPDKEEYNVSKLELYIDKSDMMINSAMFYGTDGNLYGIEVNKIKTNIDLPDSFFVFNASEFGDVEVIDFR